MNQDRCLSEREEMEWIMQFLDRDGEDLDVWIASASNSVPKDQLLSMLRRMIDPLLQVDDPTCESWIIPSRKGNALYRLLQFDEDSQMELLRIMNDFCARHDYPTIDTSSFWSTEETNEEEHQELPHTSSLLCAWFRSVFLWDLVSAATLIAWKHEHLGTNTSNTGTTTREEPQDPQTATSSHSPSRSTRDTTFLQLAEFLQDVECATQDSSSNIAQGDDDALSSDSLPIFRRQQEARAQERRFWVETVGKEDRRQQD